MFELWEDNVSSLLSIVKEFLVDVWESSKLRQYSDNTCLDPQPNSSRWDLGQDGELWNGRNGKSMVHVSCAIPVMRLVYVHVFVLMVNVCIPVNLSTNKLWS